MRISAWSSDVCSSDPASLHQPVDAHEHRARRAFGLCSREGNRKRTRHGRGAYGAGPRAVTAGRALIAVEPADLAGEVRALVGASAVMDEALLDAAIRGWSHNTRRAFRSDLILWGTWCRRRRMEIGRAHV